MRNEHGDFIWYELMSSDPDKAQEFYGGLLGWTFQDTEQPGMDYRHIEMNGTYIGGIMPLSAEMTQGGARPLWAGYLGVEDVDATIASIKKSGGNIIMPPKEIPDVGRIAFVKDPQGAMFYIMRGSSDEPSESFAQTVPRDGHCAWNELSITDPDAAETFYGQNFGWVRTDSMDMGPMGTYALYRNGADRDHMLCGIMKTHDSMPMSMWSFYFRVPDIDLANDFISLNGGTLINGPMEIPGGEFAIQAIDNQGTHFAVIGKRG